MPASSAPMPPIRPRSTSTSTATRRRCSGVKISDIFNALQSTLGHVLRQRLQRLRAHLAGQHPGRDSVSRQYRRRLPDLCAQRPRRHGADPGGGRSEAGAGAADGDPLQRISRRDRERRTQARLQLRPGARRHGAHLGLDPARRLQLRMDRHGAAGKGGERPHRYRARSWPSSSPICFSSRSTRAGTFRSRPSCRSASRRSARSARSRWPD